MKEIIFILFVVILLGCTQEELIPDNTPPSSCGTSVQEQSQDCYTEGGLRHCIIEPKYL